jgi:hypothetical protein
MRVACISFLATAVAFQPGLRLSQLRCSHRIGSLSRVKMASGPEPEDAEVKITIRKRERTRDTPSAELMEAVRAAAEETDETAEDLLAKLRAAAAAAEETAMSPQVSTVFVANFAHVKQSLATLLKFWLMGGCGAKGWSGTGELEAQHTSGTRASIEIDVEHATVSLLSSSDGSYNSKVQLGRYAAVLLDELEGLSETAEAAAADRLCYPPEAVDAARASLVPPRAG